MAFEMGEVNDGLVLVDVLAEICGLELFAAFNGNFQLATFIQDVDGGESEAMVMGQFNMGVGLCTTAFVGYVSLYQCGIQCFAQGLHHGSWHKISVAVFTEMHFDFDPMEGNKLNITITGRK